MRHIILFFMYLFMSIVDYTLILNNLLYINNNIFINVLNSFEFLCEIMYDVFIT